MAPKFRNAIFWTHLAVGVAAGLFILNMAVSGILIAYAKQIAAWEEQGQRTVVAPAGATRLDMEGMVAKARGAEGPVVKIDLAGIAPLWAEAEAKVADWRSITLRFPKSPDAPITVLIDGSSGGQPDMVSQLTLKRDTGEVVRWQPYTAQNAGQKLRAWVRPVHTGEAGGLLGQSIAVVASLGGIVLVWTGLSMAWSRFFGTPKQTVPLSSPPQSTPIPSLP